jgi:hypothetical protein
MARSLCLDGCALLLFFCVLLLFGCARERACRPARARRAGFNIAKWVMADRHWIRSLNHSQVLQMDCDGFGMVRLGCELLA